MTYYLAAGVVVAIWINSIIEDVPWHTRVLWTLVIVPTWPLVLWSAATLWVLGKLFELD